MWAKRIFIHLHGTWKDNIRSIILDWRKRPPGHSSEVVGPLVSQANLSASLCVFSCRRTPSQKGSQPQKKDMCKLYLLYFYNTQSSPSKNKNINYIFMHLRVLRCLSSGSIYDRVSKILQPNNLMVRLWSYGSFEECGAPVYCHLSQTHVGP